MGTPLFIQQTQPIMINNQQIQRVQFESQIKKQSTWFTACNVCFSLILVFDIFAYSQFFENDDERYEDDQERRNSPTNNTVKAAFGIFIAANILWFGACMGGIWGIVQFKVFYLRIYKLILYVCIVLQVIGSIVLFAGFGKWSGNYKASYVFASILTILVLISFIISARKCQINMELYLQSIQTASQ